MLLALEFISLAALSAGVFVSAKLGILLDDGIHKENFILEVITVQLLITMIVFMLVGGKGARYPVIICSKRKGIGKDFNPMFLEGYCSWWLRLGGDHSKTASYAECYCLIDSAGIKADYIMVRLAI